MNTKFLSFSILICSLFLFSKNIFINQEKYFEGEIIYKIDYNPYDENISSDQLKELLGSTMKYTFRKGNHKKEWFTPDGKLTQIRYLDIKKHTTYLKMNDLDTLYCYDIREDESDTSFKYVNDENVHEMICKVYDVQTFLEEPNGQMTDMSGRYFYAKDLGINPKWFSNYKEAKLCDIMNEAKGMLVKSNRKGLYWDTFMEVKSVNRRKVKKDELSLKDLAKLPQMNM